MEDKQIPEYYPGEYYQPLFDFMQDQFGVLALESDMTEIIHIVNKMQALHPSESAGVPMRPEDHEQVEVNQAAGMSEGEASFQAGYTAGHDVGYEKGKRDAGVKGAVWVKASERLPVSWDRICARFIHTKLILCDPGNWLPEHTEAIKSVEWLDESESPTAAGDGKEDAAAQSLPDDVIDKILKARDALVKRDLDEAYHQLYSIASPQFDKLEPWKEFEAAAAQSGKEEVLSFMDWAYENGYWHDSRDQWIKSHFEDSYTTSQLYDIYKQSK